MGLPPCRMSCLRCVVLRAIQFRQLWEGRGWACRGAAARGKTIYGSTYPLPPDSDCALSVQCSTHRWELNSLTKTRPGVRAASFCTSTANTNTCPLTNSNFSFLEHLCITFAPHSLQTQLTGFHMTCILIALTLCVFHSARLVCVWGQINLCKFMLNF